MKKMFRKNRVEAAELMTDDHFRMAGKLYRIRNVTNHGDCAVLISFYPVHNLPVITISSMYLLRNTPFKIYNQK